MRRNNLFNLTASTLLVAVNVVLATISLALQIPLFFDTLGTMLGTRLMGLKWGLLIAASGSIVNSFYDPFAIPYLPTYIATAVMVSVVYNSEKLKKLPLFVKAIFITVPSATIGGIITAYIFGGITSSGTSIILSMLVKMGFTLVQSSFIVQLVFEYIDKVIIIFLMEFIISYMPSRILEKFPRRAK